MTMWIALMFLSGEVVSYQTDKAECDRVEQGLAAGHMVMATNATEGRTERVVASQCFTDKELEEDEKS